MASSCWYLMGVSPVARHLSCYLILIRRGSCWYQFNVIAFPAPLAAKQRPGGVSKQAQCKPFRNSSPCPDRAQRHIAAAIRRVLAAFVIAWSCSKQHCELSAPLGWPLHGVTTICMEMCLSWAFCGPLAPLPISVNQSGYVATDDHSLPISSAPMTKRQRGSFQ